MYKPKTMPQKLPYIKGHNQNKKETYRVRRNIANHVSYMRLLPRKYEELLQLDNDNNNNKNLI